MVSENQIFKEILKCIDGVYILEEKSKEIIFVNEFIARGESHKFIGKKCWEAFLGENKPCSFCPSLKEANYKNSFGDDYYVWEFYDTRSNKWMSIKNRFFEVEDTLYRIGNITLTQDMMDLNKEAIGEISSLNSLISQQDKLHILLKHEATHDQMTQLFNRNRYTLDLIELYEDIDTLGVLYFDLNNLKEVNDQHKHSAGDSIINRIAEAMKSAQGENIRQYRIGGDEFVLMYKNCSVEELHHVKAGILERLDALNEGETLQCSVAVGLAFADEIEDVESVVMDADKAMYLDKQQCKARMK